MASELQHFKLSVVINYARNHTYSNLKVKSVNMALSSSLISLGTGDIGNDLYHDRACFLVFNK